MAKFSDSDIQIEAGRVYVKEQPSARSAGGNWVRVAEFFHQTDVDLCPNRMARQFAESITKS